MEGHLAVTWFGSLRRAVVHTRRDALRAGDERGAATREGEGRGGEA